MVIYLSEHIDLETRNAVLGAYITVGNREIRSQMHVPYRLYRQTYIDAVFKRLKEEVRRRALNEMRVQQLHDTTGTITHSFTTREIAPGTFFDNEFALRRLNYYNEDKEIKVNWKVEGF